MRSCSVSLAAALLVFSVPVSAANPPPPAPTEHPDWGDAAERGLTALSAALFDPSSAQIEWKSGFRWGYLKPIIGKRTHGWVACGNVNAKNRMGGYVGARGFMLFVEPSAEVTIAFMGEMLSSCDDGKHVAINPELIAALPNESRATAKLTVADELKKLAELRDAGVITQAEFDTQKAKLLAD